MNKIKIEITKDGDLEFTRTGIWSTVSTLTALSTVMVTLLVEDVQNADVVNIMLDGIREVMGEIVKEELYKMIK